MYPVLLTIGSISITSFGLFLAFSFFASVFVAWRLAKAYDLNEEKVIDLAILVAIISVLGARLFFVALHWPLFGDFGKVVWINRYAGLSFWGGLISGILALKYFSKKLNFNFWQAADFAAVSLLMGIIIGNIGCFLGGCSYGVVSELPIAAPAVGLIGKRFPVTIIESFILLIFFFYLWGQAIRFHFAGKICALTLIIVGIEKFVLEFYYGERFFLINNFWLSLGNLFSLSILILGVIIFYKKSKRNIKTDLRLLFTLPLSRKKQESMFAYLKKSVYNRKVNSVIKMKRVYEIIRTLPKTLKRRLNVKSNPKNII